MKWFYEKNTDFLQHSVNKTFEEILDMTTAEFQQWCIELRKVVVDLWDNKNQPPRVGYTEAEMAEQFNDMIGYPVHEFLVEDQLTGEKNVIRNNSNIGNAANQFFPTMMKTRINYSKGDNGKSIYDHFAREDLLDKFLLYASRHFKRDSFYNYSVSIHVNSLLKIGTLNKKFSSGVEFIEWFESVGRKIGTHDYWLSPSKEASVYTGFNDDLRDKVSLFVTRKDIERLNIPARSLSNVDWEESEYYLIRIFSYGQRLFPVGLKAFRVSFCQYAVNFPPLTARFLYERYTQHIRSQDLIRIYDPSAGWGGRILGAMSIDDNLSIHYIGTDPNTDHNTENGRTKYHELADFFNEKTSRSSSLFPKTHTYEIYQLGSEVIGNNKDFQKHQGLVDIVFTSPPYFAKEVYSDDPEQSCNKFPQYSAWRDGFLRPTLETAVKWLRNDRYLLWNIADARFGSDILPLEQDSRDILESLGMIYIETMKMALAQMPGSNRIDEKTGLPKYKNFMKVDGLWLKYEPIFVFKKP